MVGKNYITKKKESVQDNLLFLILSCFYLHLIRKIIRLPKLLWPNHHQTSRRYYHWGSCDWRKLQEYWSIIASPYGWFIIVRSRLFIESSAEGRVEFRVLMSLGLRETFENLFWLITRTKRLFFSWLITVKFNILLSHLLIGLSYLFYYVSLFSPLFLGEGIIQCLSSLWSL